MVEVERGGYLTCSIGPEKGEGNLRLSCHPNACGWEGDGAPNFRIKLGHLTL